MADQLEEPFLVDSFDVDPLGEMRVSALVRHLQNAADSHARKHQLAVDQLLASGRTWVLREFHLQVHRSPSFQEPCVVKTWATSRSAGIRAWRDFEVFSGAGERLASATSMWLMLDVSRWKLIRLPTAVLDMVNVSAPPVLEPLPIGTDFAPSGPLDEVAVHWLDVDLNGHVNNVRYLDWMMGAVPDDQWKHNRVTSLAVDFQDEARPGDFLRPAAWKLGSRAMQHRIGNGNGKLLVLARTEWNSRG